MRTSNPAPRLVLGLALGAALLGGFAIAPVAALAAEGAQRLVDDARKKLRNRDLSGAIRALEAAIQVDGKNADAHILYQDNAIDVLGPEEVTTKYRRLAADNPDDPLFGFLHVRLMPSKEGLAMARKTQWKVEVGTEERKELEAIRRRGKSEQRLATRARIILWAADGAEIVSFPQHETTSA